MASSGPLWVDWLPAEVLPGGALGLTLCPGRRDRGRVLAEDVDVLRDLGVSRLVTLLTQEDLEWAGVADLPAAVVARGIVHHRLAIPDREVPSVDEARALVEVLRSALRAGERVVLHCMGGVGRSGLVAAVLLVAEGFTPEEALALLRRVRDPHAVETAAQEAFVRTWLRKGPGSAQG